MVGSGAMLSLLASGLREFIARALAARANFLEQGIRSLLYERQAVSTFTDKVYSHPLVKSLALQSGWIGKLFKQDTPQRQISHIPAPTFVRALLDSLLALSGSAAVNRC